MSEGTSDGERRDDSFVERLGDRISAAPTTPGQAPTDGSRPNSAHSTTPPKRHAASATPARVNVPPPSATPVLGPGDFGEESTILSRESEPPSALGGTLPSAEESGLYAAPVVQPPPSRPDDAFAEFESSEMPGESTRIEESEIIADQSTAILDEGPKMPFLFVESGKDKGKEYVLQEGETGVGRGIDNDVILTDVSVSRKHLRVLRDGPNLVLRDLGSGNGTTVNGQRVHQVALNEGDRIELGETVLVVRQPTEVAATRAPASGSTNQTSIPNPGVGPPGMIPAWPSAPQLAPISGSAENIGPRDGNTATVRLPRRTLVAAVAAVAALALLVGVGVGAALLVVGRTSGEGVAPLPITSVPIAPQLGTAPVGPAIAPALATAVPPTSVAPPPTLVMAPPATGFPVPTTTVAASTFAPAAPVASTAATPPPVTVAEVEPEPEPEPESPPPTTSGRSPRSGRTPRATREPASAGLANAQARITTAYNGGDFDGAAAIARDAARHSSGTEQRTLETLANNIDSFAGLYPRIHAAGDALGPVAGTVPIALRLDRQIVSGGHYARDIQPRYVRYLVSLARAQIGSAPQTACPRVRDALELDSGNGDAQALARQCETAAARMLSDAQSHEHSDAAGAQRSYQAVQQMVPRSSATFRTAQERLTGLRRTATRPVDEDE